ncbi:serine/threonine-protein kinase [Salinibacter altiplanensis]|uniref:serine/threonine-protein kinase n=1 Tax=Salinibacter altiplanensis TaxID=1803181 RepID=UPI000C9F45F8|nr:serine/threonine-protein kinase [Salinibacter altiplanensis]
MIKAKNNLISTEVEFEKIDQVGVGQGANSDVYKIRDIQLDTIRAAKEIEASKFSNFNEYFEEAQKMHESRHPNVVPVHFSGKGTVNGVDYVYIVMDYYPRGSLAGLHQKRPLKVKEIVRYGLQFLTGLAFIHGKDLAHFDIKPTNVLLKREDVAALTDFGVAERLGGQGSVINPPFYIPHVTPERVSPGVQTQATDIYQAGLTLYRLCNTPDEWETQLQSAKQSSLEHAVVGGDFPDRDRFLPHIPRKLRTVIRKATRIDPDNRYNSVREMMNELGSVKRYLEWQMDSSGSDTGHEAWEMEDDDGRNFQIQVREDGNDWSIETTKTVNQTQRVRSCCANGLQSKEKALTRVKTFIRSDDLSVN